MKLLIFGTGETTGQIEGIDYDKICILVNQFQDVYHQLIDGYQTSFSNGHMIFHIDKDIFSTLDFRKRVIYAKK